MFFLSVRVLCIPRICDMSVRDRGRRNGAVVLIRNKAWNKLCPKDSSWVVCILQLNKPCLEKVQASWLQINDYSVRWGLTYNFYFILGTTCLMAIPGCWAPFTFTSGGWRGSAGDVMRRRLQLCILFYYKTRKNLSLSLKEPWWTRAEF
jgi:hypothetical protein